MTVADQPLTGQDVRLVSSWLHATYCSAPECGATTEEEETARTVLRALAEAGRLLPPDVDQHEEWGALMRFNGRVIGLTVTYREDAVALAARHKPLPPAEMTGEVGKRTVWHGPWEVDGG